MAKTPNQNYPNNNPNNNPQNNQDWSDNTQQNNPNPLNQPNQNNPNQNYNNPNPNQSDVHGDSVGGTTVQNNPLVNNPDSSNKNYPNQSNPNYPNNPDQNYPQSNQNNPNPSKQPNPSTQSFNPLNEKFVLVKEPNKELFSNKYETFYPIDGLTLGQSFFASPRQNETLEQASIRINRALLTAHRFYSEVEVDENGDEVWEQVIIKTTKRNVNGTVVLNNEGLPLLGANSVSRPKLIGSRHFIARSVNKDYDIGGGQKAVNDGVLVIRVA